MTVQKVVFFDEWEVEYLQRRYLENDSLEELQQREADLIPNIVTIGSNGEAIVYRNEQFRRLLAHIYAEYKQRNLPVPTTFRQQTYRHYKRAAELWAGLNLPYGSYLLKFGYSQWMKDTLEQGRIRISNAKTYDSSDLGPAIRDRELEFEEECYGMTVEVVSRDGLKKTVELIGNVKRTARFGTDFYIASFCEGYDYRLFDDFSRDSNQPYDACLVIRERDLFIDRMRQEGERQLPGWDFYQSPIAYLDPHDPTQETNNLDVSFVKHLRYAYQREFRTVWMPPTAYKQVDPLFFELGSLQDFCDLLIL